MQSQELREKLTAYIKVADDKNLEEIYKLVEDKINKDYRWWEDEAFVAELEEIDRRIEFGDDKGYAINDVSTFLDKRKAERYAT